MSARDWGVLVWQDLRAAATLLRKNYIFTSVTLVVLALGIGVNTAIFSLVDAVLLQPLHVADPDRLVLVEGRSATGGALISYPMYRDLVEHQSVFSDLIAARDYAIEPLRVRVGSSNLAQAVRGGAVTGNYFSGLGLLPTAGRLFVPADADPNHPASVAVVSYDFWRQQLAGSPSVVGQTVQINDEPFTLVGVAPPGFTGLSIDTSVQIWVPLTKFRDPRELTGREGTFFKLIGRLKDGVSVQTAEQSMSLLFQQLRTDEDRAAGKGFQPAQRFHIALHPGDRGFSLFRETIGRPSLILMVMAVLLLTAVCLNLTTLLAARASTRHREMAVRQALGASFGRLVQQLLTEHLLLAVIGGALGLLIALWASQLLLGFIATEIAFHSGFNHYVPDGLRFRFDLRVFAFTTAMTLLVGVVLGLAPALLLLRRRELSVVLRERTSTASALSVGRGRVPIGKVLVAAQVAVSVALLVGAGLLVRTVLTLRSLPLGFDPEHVLMVDFDVTDTHQTGDRLIAFEQGLLDRLRAMPGVHSASLSWISLFSDSDRRMSVLVEGQTPPAKDENLPFARKDVVSSAYFETLGMTLVGGRTFSPRDNEASPRVAVVNEAFAHRFFPNGDALGRRFSMTRTTDPAAMIEIVGVIKNAKYNDLRDDTRDMFYLPLLQAADTAPRSIQVRTQGPPERLATSIRQIVGEADRKLVITDIKTLEDQVDRTLVRERLLASLSGFFGGAALLLACIGLYSVMAYHVMQRTKELGLRIALGSTQGQIMWMVLHDALLLVGLGLLAGIPIALGLSRSVESLLFGLTPADPFTIAAVVIILLSVAAVASYLPARRAAHVDPMIALRTE